MAKKKNKPTDEANPANLDSGLDELLAAVQGMIEKYKVGHTINGYDDYRYPGLKEVVIALDKLSLS